MCSDLQSKTGKPAIVRVFQPTLSATDGRANRHYLQLNLQSAGSNLQSPPPNRHYLQPKRHPETHLIVPKLDVVFWTVFLDGGKPCQTLRGLRWVWLPTNVRFLDRSRSKFSVADNVGSNPSIAGSARSIAGSVADNSGLTAFQLQIIPVGKWRRLQVCRVSIAGCHTSPLKVLENLLYNKAILNHLEVSPCLAKSWSGLSRTDLSR